MKQMHNSKNTSSSSPRLLLHVVLLSTALCSTANAFEFPNPFANKAGGASLAIKKMNPVQSTKATLLESISGTNNGKSATVEQQRNVLELVRKLETTQPAPPTILTTDATIIDGTWYLQYTSPSSIESSEEDSSSSITWKPVDATEGESRIETKQFKQSQGAVSAQGIKVETANRVVKQIIDATASRVTNEITLDWGQVVVGGKFRPSTSVPNRAVVAFDQADLLFGKDGTDPSSSVKFRISLAWLFALTAVLRGGVKDNGWLETTYIDQDLRIGRGNKGTMFVLTRKADAVTP